MSPQERLAAIGIIAGDMCAHRGEAGELTKDEEHIEKWFVVRMLALATNEWLELNHTVIIDILRDEGKRTVPHGIFRKET